MDVLRLRVIPERLSTIQRLHLDVPSSESSRYFKGMECGGAAYSDYVWFNILNGLGSMKHIKYLHIDLHLGEIDEELYDLMTVRSTSVSFQSKAKYIERGFKMLRDALDPRCVFEIRTTDYLGKQWDLSTWIDHRWDERAEQIV